MNEWEDKNEEKGSDGVVKRWLREIELSEKVEKQWIKDAEGAIDVFRGDHFKSDEGGSRKESFNILWSNIETKRPALYNSEPRPDIRRRHKQEDQLGMAISEILERGIVYAADSANLDEGMVAAVNDMLLSGRGITRIKYVPTMAKEIDSAGELVAGGDSPDTEDEDSKETVAFQEVAFEQVEWNRFRRGGGNVWGDVMWIGFEHHLTKDQFKDKWPDFVDKINYDVSEDKESDSEGEADSDSSMFKRVKVWEIWDKEEREVIFFAESYADKVLETIPDPLDLIDFYPIPKPLYAIEGSTSLVPLCEYSMYETLAKELENLTNRIRRIIDGIRVRGLYDTSIGEMSQIFDSGDNEFIPAENLSRLLEGGGLDKGIWMLPLEQISQVLEKLYQRREALIGEIYEVTGISDILRGNTNPYETKGAQEIKASVGAGRLKRQQKDVQRYARDLIRLAVEIICDKFSRETLTMMTGLSYPTAEEKQKAQQALQGIQRQQQEQAMMAQQQGQQPPPPQPPPPELVEIAQKPSWEDLEKVFKSDITREYRIDVETDSTIEEELNRDKQNVSELLNSLSRFMGELAPALEAGFLKFGAYKALLLSAARRFKLGRMVEDEINSMEPPGENKQKAAQQKIEQERSKTEQMRAQMEGQDKQGKQQLEQMKLQGVQQKQEFDQQVQMQESKLEELRLQNEQQRLQLDQARLQSDEAIAMRKIEEESISEDKDRELKREDIALNAQLKFLDIQLKNNPNEENWQQLSQFGEELNRNSQGIEESLVAKKLFEDSIAALSSLTNDLTSKVQTIEQRVSDNGVAGQMDFQSLVNELKRPKTVDRDKKGRIYRIK